MYWLYFTLFLIAVLTPIFVEGERGFLPEDVHEASIILVSGAVAFIMYALKEKSLLKHVREKLWFQQKTTDITKDLSQSYSYIGEVNRKMDILRGMMHRLVEIRENQQEPERMLWEVLDTIKYVTQAERVSIRIFTDNLCTHRLEEPRDKKIFATVRDEDLLANGKNFFETSGLHVVSSQELRKNTKIFLLFSKAHNDEVDESMVKILLAFLAILDTFVSADKPSV